MQLPKFKPLKLFWLYTYVSEYIGLLSFTNRCSNKRSWFQSLTTSRKHQRRQSRGLRVAIPTPHFGLGIVGGRRMGRWGRGRVVKYYFILSCTGSIFESGDF